MLDLSNRKKTTKREKTTKTRTLRVRSESARHAPSKTYYLMIANLRYGNRLASLQL